MAEGMPHPPMRPVASREVYANQYLRLREDRIEFADGTPGVYTIVEKGDFTVVLPYADGGFWLVEQYRYPLGRREWEFPQGGWPPGHGGGTAEELAVAELVEETGLRADRLDHLGRLNSAPGYASNHFDVYLATGLTAGEPQREPTEADMVHAFFPEEDVWEMVRSGRFRDSNCVAALALWQLFRAEAPVTFFSKPPGPA